MKQFNWEEFKDGNNKIAVHCKTEEEAIQDLQSKVEAGEIIGYEICKDVYFIGNKDGV